MIASCGEVQATTQSHGRKRVLLLVHRVPYPPNRGDRIRSYQILKYLAERYDVSLATLADEPVSSDTESRLNAWCSNVAIHPVSRFRWLKGMWSLLRGQSATQGLFHSSLLASDIRRWSATNPFDAVVVFCSSMVPYLNATGVRDVPIVLDLVDVDSQKFYDYAMYSRSPKAWLYRLEAKRLRALESAGVNKASTVTLVSDAETRLFCQVCPNDRTVAMPNGVDLEYFTTTAAAYAADPIPATLVFTGALDYQANVDGIVWFARHVWPLIRQAQPQATLNIVGRCPVPGVMALENIEGIHVFASVPDVRPYLAGATMSIAPLRVARGIQNKVLEAMAMGKPVVCSPAALEGLAAEPGRDLMVADHQQQWSEIIIQLLKSEAQAKELAVNGRKYVERFHDWQINLAVLEGLIGAPAPEVAQATSPASAEYVNA